MNNELYLPSPTLTYHGLYPMWFCKCEFVVWSEASFSEVNRSYHAIAMFIISEEDRDQVLKVSNIISKEDRDQVLKVSNSISEEDMDQVLKVSNIVLYKVYS